MLFGQAKGDLKQSREHLDVFVAVEMSWGDARVANLLDLGVPLALDFAGFQAAAGDAEEQALGAAFQFACGVEQAADVFQLAVGGPSLRFR